MNKDAEIDKKANLLFLHFLLFLIASLQIVSVGPLYRSYSVRALFESDLDELCIDSTLYSAILLDSSLCASSELIVSAFNCRIKSKFLRLSLDFCTSLEACRTYSNRCSLPSEILASNIKEMIFVTYYLVHHHVTC